MASDLALAHLAAKERLQDIVRAAVIAAWKALPHYDRENLDQFLSTVLPLTAAANRQAVALTQAFIARAISQQPAPFDANAIIAGIRNGTTPETVYTRAFVTVWSELKAGKAWDQATAMGMGRAADAAETDVQLSFTHTLSSWGRSGIAGSDRIVAWQRVPDGAACDLCMAASGQDYGTGSLLPIHGNCRCGVEPTFGSGGTGRGGVGLDDEGPDQFSGEGDLTVAVQQHGELGPVLTVAGQNFLNEQEALAR